jgi:4-azaleucine resistance transporter AzlC
MHKFNGRSHPIFDGMIDISPLVLAAAPFGILYGALAQASGLSIATTMAMSILVFAGASQFVAVNLLLASAPIIMIIAATFIVNLRHLMYGAHLMEYVKHLSRSLRAIMAFWLTDEAYAVMADRTRRSYDRSSLHYYYLGAALFMYLNWQTCSYIGFELGLQLSDPMAWGLDFAMVVAFIGVIVPLLKKPPMWICATTAFVSSLFSREWPYQSGLIFSILIAITLAMIASKLRRKPHV